jgi:predicted GNAT family acetyltransferase
MAGGDRVDVEVVDVPSHLRYEARTADGRVAGRVEYALRPGGDVIELIHTEVDPAFEGKGIGGQLARGVFDDVRARGRRADVRCEFLQGWAARHPDVSDLLVSADS